MDFFVGPGGKNNPGCLKKGNMKSTEGIFDIFDFMFFIGT